MGVGVCSPSPSSQKRARCEPSAVTMKVILVENDLPVGMGSCYSQGKQVLYSLLGSAGIKDAFAVPDAGVVT